jgi:hypothetical protein
MGLTVQHLYAAYVVAVKDIPGDKFIEKLLKPLSRLDSRETGQPLEILLQYATDEEKAKGNDAIAVPRFAPSCCQPRITSVPACPGQEPA